MKTVKAEIQKIDVYHWDCPYCGEHNDTTEEEIADDMKDQCFMCERPVKLRTIQRTKLVEMEKR